MTSPSRAPVARLSSPGSIVATVPALCGFPPDVSVVLLSLRGPRKRLGLTVRLDLPDPSAEQEAAQLLADRMRDDGAAAAVVVVFGESRHGSLVDAVSTALEEHGIELAEALHADRGLWWSYACARPCCPAEGTPVPAPPALVEAQCVLDGRAVLASREELVASLASPAFLAAERAAQLLDDATVTWVRAQSRDAGAARAAALVDARALLDHVSGGGCVEPAAAAELAVALHDVLVRDEVATWSLKRSDALLSLLEQVVRQVPPPYDAPVCTLLAWVSYARGDGSRANVALDRALDTDPAYSLALLLRTALDGAVPPRDIRAILEGTERALRNR